MHNAFARRLAIVLAASLVATPVLAQTLRVKTPAGEATFTADQLEAMPRIKLTIGSGASTLAYEGVEVGALLAKTGLTSGENVHGQAFASAVVVRSRDGYLTVLSLAETNPTVRREPVIVADRMNGTKIDDREGPLRLVVGGDLRQARSARQVSAIEVRPLAP